MENDYENYVAPAVIRAAENNDYEEVKKLLSEGHDPNALHELTWDNPLLIAIYNGNTAMANTLLDVGADPNYGNADGESAIHAATRLRNLEIVKRLVEEFKMEVNETDSRHYTPLHLAVANDDLPMVEYLLRKKADPNELTGDNYGEDVCYDTPLHLLKTDNVEMANMLINAGADINKMNSDRMTPLYWACATKKTNVALLLLSLGAKKNIYCDRGYNALDISQRNNLTEVINKLVG